MAYFYTASVVRIIWFYSQNATHLSHGYYFMKVRGFLLYMCALERRNKLLIWHETLAQFPLYPSYCYFSHTGGKVRVFGNKRTQGRGNFYPFFPIESFPVNCNLRSAVVSNFLEQKWHSIHNKLQKGTHTLQWFAKKYIVGNNANCLCAQSTGTRCLETSTDYIFKCWKQKSFERWHHLLDERASFALLLQYTTTGTKRGWMSVRRVQNIPQSHTPFLQGLRPKLYTLIVCSNTNLVIHMWSFVLPWVHDLFMCCHRAEIKTHIFDTAAMKICMKGGQQLV